MTHEDNHNQQGIEGSTATVRNLWRLATSRHWFVRQEDRDVAARAATDLEEALRRIAQLEAERPKPSNLSVAIKKARGGEAPPLPGGFR